MASEPHRPMSCTASSEYPSLVRNCAPDTRHVCWENRGLGSPARPGLSMVAPVSWMVSRKTWISWSCEMVYGRLCWVSKAFLVGVGTWLGISCASCRCVSSWHGVGICVGNAWLIDKCKRVLERHKRRLSRSSGLARSGMSSVRWLWFGAIHVMLWLLLLRCL